MSNKLTTALLASCALGLLSGAAMAQDFDYGKFDGYTLKVKLIGGTQYEKLYTRIPEWEALTGAKVEIVSSKNHFDLDREIKQDIASGSITWCVGSNHTSFAPQYGDLYVDLKELIPQSELDKYVPGTLASAMVDGRLVQLPRVTDVSNLYYRKSLYAGKTTLFGSPSTSSSSRSSSSLTRRTSTAPPSPARTRACRVGSWRSCAPMAAISSMKTGSRSSTRRPASMR